MVMGEITTKANVDIAQIVRDTVSVRSAMTALKIWLRCRYLRRYDWHWTSSHRILLWVLTRHLKQKRGIDERTADRAIGAGDQGMMFGYATNETRRIYAIFRSTCTEAGKTADKGAEKTAHCLI